MKNLNEKDYNTVLTEANDYFAAQGISIVGSGYAEIASNAALFESYVDSLTEGCQSADDAANMAQLMANTNSNILRESSMTGIQPIASLSMPVIRKLWPKFALKEALPTEVAKTPRFVVTYTAPYMFKGDNERIDLPRGLKGDHNELHDAARKIYTAEHTVKIAAGSAVVVDFLYTDDTDENGAKVASPSKVDAHVQIADTPSTAKLQPLDELVFVSAYYGDKEDATNDGTTRKGTIKIGKKLGVYGNGVYEFENGQLFVQFDGANRKATFAAIGDVAYLVVKAGVSSEYNEESWSVGFDIKRQDIDIPTGEHINAPLPIEALNDMMALYQIDGTKETVDLMTNVFAMKLDLEVLDFIRDSFLDQPRNEAFNGYPGASEYAVMFDCKPAAGFAGSPKAWREEIKPVIDHLAQKVKNNTYLQAGMFTIIANPLDVQILANVDWQFRGGQGGNMDGVDVDYSVGTYVGANAYKVIASTNVPAGAMYLIFAPSSNTQMTYKYFPYSFSTELGYTDPNRSRTPSVMMTQRHTFHEFMPAVGCIVIKNNDGAWFNDYVSTKAYTD